MTNKLIHMNNKLSQSKYLLLYACVLRKHSYAINFSGFHDAFIYLSPITDITKITPTKQFQFVHVM